MQKYFVYIAILLLASCSEDLFIVVNHDTSPIRFEFRERGIFHVDRGLRLQCIDRLTVNDLTLSNAAVWQIIRSDSHDGKCEEIGSISYGAKINGYKTTISAKPLKNDHRYRVSGIANGKAGLADFRI